MPQYIQTLADVIGELYQVPAIHLRTELVRHEVEGLTVCQNRVEVFELHEHPRAEIAFAWGWNDDTGTIIYDAVLKVPPVTSALEALLFAAKSRRLNG